MDLLGIGVASGPHAIGCVPGSEISQVFRSTEIGVLAGVADDLVNSKSSGRMLQMICSATIKCQILTFTYPLSGWALPRPITD